MRTLVWKLENELRRRKYRGVAIETSRQSDEHGRAKAMDENNGDAAAVLIFPTRKAARRSCKADSTIPCLGGWNVHALDKPAAGELEKLNGNLKNDVRS